MKEKVLVATENVISAQKLINKLLNRQKNEIPGLGLIYGETGFGKTRFGEEIAARNEWLYLRMLAGFSEKVFLQEIYRRLNLHLNGDDSVMRAHAAYLEIEIINMLKQHTDIVIVIDEINLVFLSKKWKILEMIRDFVDSSHVTIILIGENDTYQKLLAYNNHFFDRCGFFYTFKANTKKDFQTVCNEISEVKFSDDLVNYIHKTTKGNVRKAIDKMIPYFEKLGIDKGMTSITLADVR